MLKRFTKPSKLQSFFLFGPRGSGKSTLLKGLFLSEDLLWIDLLNQKLEFELSTDPDSLIDLWKVKKPKWIVIDEVQKIPRLLDVVHRAIEEYKIHFALTGSSARKLKRGGANLLAGRAVSYSLSPFSALELGDQFNLHQALSTGLLPRFWNEELTDADRIRSLYTYVQTYLKEEVAAEQLVRNLDPFRRVLVAAAQSNTKIINYAAIERDAGVAHSQAERHFEIFTDTLIGRYLEPFDTSIRKRQTKKSKFYFFDAGIVRALTNLAGETLTPSTFEYGELFETFLINEFFKLSEALEKRWRFSFLRTKDDVEIDLIIEKPRGAPILIEIKSSKDKLNSDKLTSFKKIAEKFKGSSKFVLSCHDEPRVIDDILCLHWKEGLKTIFQID
jgi:predicted AAA+ superfamily ATPase